MDSIANTGFVGFCFLVLLSWCFGIPILMCLNKSFKNWAYAINLGGLSLFGMYSLGMSVGNNSRFALGTIISFFIIIFVIYFLIQQKYKSGMPTLTQPQNLVLVLTFFLITAYVGQDFLVKDIRYFWGSGNPDLTDGINGAAHFLKKTGSLSEAHPYFNFPVDNDFDDWKIRSQYLSISFLSEIFGPSPSLGLAFLLNLFMLGSFFLSLHLLFFTALRLNFLPSLILSASSASAALYVSTYYSGHIGSLISGASLPLLLAGLYQVVDNYSGSYLRNRNVLFYLFVTFPITFLYFTSYPYTFIFTLILFSVPILYQQKMPRFLSPIFNSVKSSYKRGISFILIVVAISFWLFRLAEPFRMRATTEYRAASNFLRLDLFNLFFGLPYIDFIPHFLFAGVLMFIVCIIFAIKPGPAEQIELKSNNLIFVGLFIILAIFFRFFIADSYYFYKYLYTNQFLFILMLFFAFKKISTIYVKNIFVGLLVVLEMLNLKSIAQVKNIQSQQSPGRELSDWSPIFDKYKNGCFIPSTERNFMYINKFYMHGRNQKKIECVMRSPNSNFLKLIGAPVPVYADAYKEVFDVESIPFFDFVHYPIVVINNDIVSIAKNIKIVLYNTKVKKIQIQFDLKSPQSDQDIRISLAQKSVFDGVIGKSKYHFEKIIQNQDDFILIEVFGQNLEMSNLSYKILNSNM